MVDTNRKGVSPIIATVLLLMMTVAVAGGAYFWFSNVQSSLQSNVEQRVGQSIQQGSQNIRIAFAGCTFVNNTDRARVSFIIQNTGTQPIDGSFLMVLQKNGEDLASNQTEEFSIESGGYSDKRNLTLSDGGDVIDCSEAPTTFSLEASISKTSSLKLVNCSKVKKNPVCP